MANEMSLFSNGAQLPAYLQNLEMDEATKALAGGGGGLRISIKGGVFRMLNGGAEIAKNEDRAMNMVVVASSSDVFRTYYEGTFVEGENKPPVCWSSDGIVPDADVKTPQAKSCATCPQNIAGSGEGDSRACRYSRRLAVVLENDFEGHVYQVQLPAQSIFGKPETDGRMPLAAYAKQLLQHRIPITAVVTEFRFDTSSATPKLTFRAVRPLTLEEMEVCKAQGASPSAQDAIKMSVFQQDGGEVDASAVFSQDTKEEDVQAVQQPAVTAAVAKPRAPRTKKSETVAATTPAAAPAASASVTATATPIIDATDDEEAQLEAAMAALRAKKAAAAAVKAASAAATEPVVVQQKATATAPTPTGVADILSQWGDDDDDA